ncbi:MAG: sugar transferase [Pirellulales bacterium]|nr:sugar transferase [Pirellulales bacterium]
MTKRIFDIAGASLGLLFLSPLLLAVAVAIRVSMGSPVFFIQQRPGRHGKLFRLVKFRSMMELVESEEANTIPDSDKRRLTHLGRFLRASSIDELPELWNVLRGEMSLVGPRPLLVEYLPLYTAEQSRRHEVRPGITGWAQVNGRNAISWEGKFALDVWYVDHQSLWLDLKVLARTVWKVVLRQGISADKHATMPKFERPTS